MLDNLNGPSSQDIVERIKSLGQPDSPVEQPEEEPREVDVSEEDTLSDELETEEFEEAESEELDESEQEYDGEESYFEIDGEEITLSQIKEWKDSGLRQSDYTRKTQEAAELRKEAEARIKQADTMAEALSDKISELEGIIQGEEATTDWEELLEDDPSEYLRRQRQIDAKKAKLAEAKAQKQSRIQAKAAEESKLLISKMPTWSDPEVQKKDIDACLKYAESIGFKSEDFQTMTDHRVILALVQASKQAAIETNKPLVKKKVAKVPKAIKPVKGKVKARPTEMEEAKKRLKKSGSKDDALAALKLFYK